MPPSVELLHKSCIPRQMPIIGLLILDCLIMKLSSPDFLRFSIAKENDPTLEVK